MRLIDVKALIVKDGKFLMLKAKSSGKEWDLPGTRLGKEKASTSLAKAVKKECNITVELVKPVMMSSYTDHGQKVFVMVFLCRFKSGKLKLSEKYDSFKWVESHAVAPAKDEEIIDLGIG